MRRSLEYPWIKFNPSAIRTDDGIGSIYLLKESTALIKKTEYGGEFSNTLSFGPIQLLLKFAIDVTRSRVRPIRSTFENPILDFSY